jgi:hypothetical protein
MFVTIEFSEKTNQYIAREGSKIIGRRNSRETLENWVAKTGRKIGAPAEVQEAATAKSEFSVAERFEFIEKFVGMVARKVMPSMIITGNGGIGKTFTVTNTLLALGKEEIGYGIDSAEDGDFIVFKGFTTAKAMYRNLYENNGKIIVCDDMDSAFKDPICANILKGALDSGEKRIISWGAEFKGEDDLPNRFEFTGQVIFISNLPQNKFPQALLSRSLRVDLTLNTEEVVDRIETILNETADEEVSDVIDFIKENANKFTDLNIRSAMTILKIRDSIGEGWERMALYNATA